MGHKPLPNGLAQRLRRDWRLAEAASSRHRLFRRHESPKNTPSHHRIISGKALLAERRSQLPAPPVTCPVNCAG